VKFDKVAKEMIRNYRLSLIPQTARLENFKRPDKESLTMP